MTELYGKTNQLLLNCLSILHSNKKIDANCLSFCNRFFTMSTHSVSKVKYHKLVLAWSLTHVCKKQINSTEYIEDSFRVRFKRIVE